MKPNEKAKRDRHLIICAGAEYAVKGSQAEREAIQYLLDHLDPSSIGDYRLLANYNINDRKSGQSLEVDVAVICRLGIFLLEVKSWKGTIEGYDDVWVFKGQERRKNAFKLIDRKAKVLHSLLFDRAGWFPELGRVSVIGLVVLAQGLRRYIHKSNDDKRKIVDLSPFLIDALSTQTLLHSGSNSSQISDEEIQTITNSLYKRHEPREIIVHNYRIVRELSYTDLCDTFEAQHTQIETRRVRLKRYQFQSFSEDRMQADLRKFQRSIKAVSAMGSHPHILSTLDFFEDDIQHQQDVFYEITELPTDSSLDEIIDINVQQGRSLPLARQLQFLQPVGEALKHAHSHRNERGRADPIYHRNVCPETIFRMKDGTVKLGDFDFAKFGDETITVPNETLVDRPYTAPEVLANSSLATASSDIYALGVLWFFLAALPATPVRFDPRRIDMLSLPEQARVLLKQMTAAKSTERPEQIDKVLTMLAEVKNELENA